MNKSRRVISFGAGVQSSALLLMSDREDRVPRADFAVFADTGNEPAEVYAWLSKMKDAVSIPIITATQGNLGSDVIANWRGEISRASQPPFFALTSAGEKAMIRRHCTRDYKIRPVDRAIAAELGYRPRQRIRVGVEVLIGISYDEMERMRRAEEPWKTNVYPLVDLALRRSDCVRYVEALGLGTPPRSACYFCPYKSNAEWRRLRDEAPDDWVKAVEFDAAIRRSISPSMTSEFFVHRSRVPLNEADIDVEPVDRQLSFLDECEGMCGV